jgi:hypothetical protein
MKSKLNSSDFWWQNLGWIQGRYRGLYIPLNETNHILSGKYDHVWLQVCLQINLYFYPCKIQNLLNS